MSYANYKTTDVQRLSPSGRVKPQANGGRKITLLYLEDVQIVYTQGNSCGYLYGISIELRSIENKISTIIKNLHVLELSCNKNYKKGGQLRMKFGKKDIHKDSWYHGYKFQLFPTDEQKEYLDRCIDVTRFLYNWTIEQEETQMKLFDAGKTSKISLSFPELSSKFTKLRNENDMEFLKSIPHCTEKNAVKRAHAAYENYFNHITRHPKFRHKKDYTNRSFETREGRMFFIDDKLKIEGLNTMIQLKYHTGLDKHYRKFKNAVIVRDVMGQYWITFCLVEPKPLEYFDNNNIKPLGRAIGIDLNNKKRFVLSTGKIFYGPDLSKETRKLARKQAKRQRDIDRRKKMERINPLLARRSKRARKREIQCEKQYKRISDIVETFIQETTKKIINMRPKAVVMENLPLKDILKIHVIAKNIHHADFGRSITVMKQKCNKYGIPFMQARRDFPSSQLCSKCGNRQKIGRAETYICPHCGFVEDRDINAALNLENLAYC